MAYTRARMRSLPADRQVVHDPKHDDLQDENYDVDEQLGELTKKVIRRCHQEIHNYTVPQLLSALHKCLQVRVLMATLRQKGGGENVGSAVRKYSESFKQAPDDVSRGKRGARSRRPAFSDPDDDTVISLVTDD